MDAVQFMPGTRISDTNSTSNTGESSVVQERLIKIYNQPCTDALIHCYTDADIIIYYDILVY